MHYTSKEAMDRETQGFKRCSKLRGFDGPWPSLSLVDVARTIEKTMILNAPSRSQLLAARALI